MTTPNNSALYLPDDVIVEILLRLPAIILLRFKLVCKTWFDIISSSSFAYKQFYGQSNDTYKPLVCWATDVDSPFHTDFIYSALLFSNVILGTPVNLKTGIFPKDVTAVCGPCNGIVCVRFVDKKLALWNPTTRRLWPIPSDSSPAPEHFLFSFWIDPLTNDFKVFWVNTYLENRKWRREFVMYTSCDNSWTRFQGEEALFYPDDVVQQYLSNRYTVANGYYYFLKKSGRTKDYVIVAFDHVNHLFQEIQMPPKIDSCKRVKYLDLYDGDSLAVFTLDSDGMEGIADRQCVETWVMKEMGCWRKLFNVIEISNLSERPVGFWKKSGLFISYFNYSNGLYELKIYDTVSGTAQKLQVGTPFDIDEVLFFPLCYKESLVSVKM